MGNIYKYRFLIIFMARKRKSKSTSVKVQVTLTKEQGKKITDLQGIMGDSESEVIRTIVANWLIERER